MKNIDHKNDDFYVKNDENHDFLHKNRKLFAKNVIFYDSHFMPDTKNAHIIFQKP